MKKTEFIPSVVMACYGLHNIALDQDADFPIDVEDSSYGDNNESCKGTEHPSCYQVFSNYAFVAYLIL